ncbi:MAG TPA: prolyl oligopeptidase family serine peptidase [Azospirillaceae bacterium]|nr:prolyl oligopeptidase family serine peptidase [Azospirillaceae bacterium]
MLISRRQLFGVSPCRQPRLSPNGLQIAYIAPVEGVPNIWVAPVADLAAARPLTRQSGRGIAGLYSWAAGGQYLLARVEPEAPEIAQVLAIRVADGRERALTPRGANGEVVGETNARYPYSVTVRYTAIGESVAGISAFAPFSGGTWRVDLRPDGVERREAERLDVDDDFSRVLLGPDAEPLLATRWRVDGGIEVLRADDVGAGGKQWTIIDTVAPHDAPGFQVVSLHADGRRYYRLNARGRQTAALELVELKTGVATEVAADPRVDLGDAWGNRPFLWRDQGEIVGWRVEDGIPAWRFCNPGWADAYASMCRQLGGIVDPLGCDRSGRWWLVAASGDTVPPTCHLYDRDIGTLINVFQARPELAGRRLRPTTPVTIPARDGVDLPGYLTVPVRGAGPWPMVIDVHGGLAHRTYWGFDARTQWLADRGYAVLKPNARGSGGYGPAFENAGAGEWGRRVPEDIIDCVDWAVAQGVAEPQHVGLMGGSAGGYVTLQALAMAPERFACGVAICAASDMEQWLSQTPVVGGIQGYFRRRLARVGVVADDVPLRHPERLVKPLLLIHGRQDPRVPVEHTERLAAALAALDRPVSSLLVGRRRTWVRAGRQHPAGDGGNRALPGATPWRAR